MKTKIALFAVAIAFAVTAAAPSAHAGNELAKAKKIADEMMVHVSQMATLLDKNINAPAKAIDGITAYFTDKKRVKALKTIAAKAKGLQLTDADKKELKKYAANSKVVKRVSASFKTFFAKNQAFFQSNPALMQKLFKAVMKLQGMMPK